MGTRGMQVGSVRRWAWTFLLAFAAGASAFGDVVHPTGVPLLSSRPGAAYTLYLDFDGFSFTGTWGGLSGGNPGDTPAYLDRTTGFTAADAANIQKIWSRAAEKYSAFDINVTTIDPAVATGQADTDAHRQAFYDSTAGVMHTVIGGTGAWNGGGGGTSYVGVTQYTYTASLNGGAGAGWHTNFVFAATAPDNLQYIGEAAAHENGHGLGLIHQGDHFGATNNEYSTNNGATGPGSYAPIMGDSYIAQRGTWRVGTTDSTPQNDVKVIAANARLGTFVDDAIGHLRSSATPLPLRGDGTVDYTRARGVIVPLSSSSPQPLSPASYTTDLFSFRSNGGPITLTANDGGELVAPGTADPGAILNSTLTILDAAGNFVAAAPLSSSTLAETYSGTLAPGNYFAEIASFGGQTSTYDPSASYYDMGSYFLTGAGFNPTAVPEPAAGVIFALMAPLLLRRRRSASSGL